MKNNIVLVRPTLELKEEALAYRSEHFQSGKVIRKRDPHGKLVTGAGEST